MSTRKPRPPVARKQKSATTIEVESRTGVDARLIVKIDAQSFTSDDVRLFVAGINAMHASDAVLWNSDAYSELGSLYVAAWSIQDCGRKFRADSNPLHAWRALQLFVDSSFRTVLQRNGPKLQSLQEKHAKILRAHADAADALKRVATPAERNRLTRKIESLARKFGPLTREINARTWLGDPIPEWLSAYFQGASAALFAVPLNTGSKYPHAVARALGFSKAGGGASAHSRLRDQTRQRKQLADRLIESAKQQGTALSDDEVGHIFSVPADTAKSWRRGKKG